MPIIIAPIGQELRITKILLDADKIAELTKLNIVVNAVVVLRSVGSKEIIVEVDGNQVVLNADLGTKILVA